MGNKLAIDGGQPARSRRDDAAPPLLGTSLYGDEEVQAVSAVIRERRLWRYQGWRTSAFENTFRDHFSDGVGRALAVNSGTSALYLAFVALGLSEGSEIYIPTIGFIAAATAARAAGLVPRFVPVDRGLGIDLPYLTKQKPAAAVLAVHPYGAPCDITGVLEWARHNGALVVEDVAQCLGGSHQGRQLGRFGIASAFSFQHFKLLSTGEGGMLVSHDDKLADRAQAVHDAATDWTVPAVAGRTTDVGRPPMNMRMSELEAALGLVQLTKVDDILDRLRAVHRYIVHRLSKYEHVECRPIVDPSGDTGASVVFFLENAHLAQRTCDALDAEGVRARTLLGGEGHNRHWAGDWLSTLRRCRIEVPHLSVVDRDRELLGGAIHIPVDIGFSQADIEETCEALDKVLTAQTRMRS